MCFLWTLSTTFPSLPLFLNSQKPSFLRRTALRCAAAEGARAAAGRGRVAKDGPRLRRHWGTVRRIPCDRRTQKEKPVTPPGDRQEASIIPPVLPRSHKNPLMPPFIAPLAIQLEFYLSFFLLSLLSLLRVHVHSRPTPAAQGGVRTSGRSASGTRVVVVVVVVVVGVVVWWWWWWWFSKALHHSSASCILRCR